MALILFLACTWAGSRKRSQLETRTRVISDFLADIRKLRDIMALTPMPIAQAALRLSSGIWVSFTQELQSSGVRVAWQRSLDSCHLYDEDRDVLERFTDVLHANEMCAQQNELTLLLKELDERRSSLLAELEKKGKMYSSLGVLLGLSLALLVI